MELAEAIAVIHRHALGIGNVWVPRDLVMQLGNIFRCLKDYELLRKESLDIAP